MISRKKFHELTMPKQPIEMVSHEEMCKYLKKNARKLTLDGTLLILKEYFGVEIGDTIIIGGGVVPSEARCVVVDDTKCAMFLITDIKVDNYISMFIDGDRSEGNGYSGGSDSDGIFTFFMGKKIMIVIKPCEEE
jgi:hypothetical protein